MYLTRAPVKINDLRSAHYYPSVMSYTYTIYLVCKQKLDIFFGDYYYKYMALFIWIIYVHVINMIDVFISCLKALFSTISYYHSKMLRHT